MSSLCTQETYNHSLFLALFSYVTMYMLHTMMGKQMEEDSVHPAIDVATQSQIFFSPFCAVLSSVVADPEMRERELPMAGIVNWFAQLGTQGQPSATVFFCHIFLFAVFLRFFFTHILAY